MAVTSTASNSTISQIQQQVVTLRKDVTQENANNTDDAKSKALKLEQYQLQISQDNLAIQQLSLVDEAGTTASAGAYPATTIDLQA